MRLFKWLEEGFYGAFCGGWQRFAADLEAGRLDDDRPRVLDVETSPPPAEAEETPDVPVTPKPRTRGGRKKKADK